MRQTRKTPAVTMVAAWISAETGVGPSIASGNQVCRPICADLPQAPRNSSTPISSIALRPRKVSPVCCGTAAKISEKSMLSKVKKTSATPSMKKKSPTRLTTKALIAAALALSRSYQ